MINLVRNMWGACNTTGRVLFPVVFALTITVVALSAVVDMWLLKGEKE